MGRYIEVDAIQKIVDSHCAKGCDGLAAACQECGADELVKEIVLKTPGIEIVRCKECKHCRPIDWVKDWYGSCRWFNTHAVQADDFCSYGERRVEWHTDTE